MHVAYLTHPFCTLHEMGSDHPECPDRVRVIDDRMRASGLLDLMGHLDVRPVLRHELERVHASHYLDSIESMAPQSGYCQVDPDTLMNPHTRSAAQHAAGAVVVASEAVARGAFCRAFCNVRPPGHHAMRDRAMGFCFYNNIAVGIHAALATGLVHRVALVDFDVHHGNGSEDILAGHPQVRMYSTFQSPLYPFCGETPLADNILSVPLAPYSRGVALREAVQNIWLPALHRQAPDMLFISAGFDAHRDDELGQLGWLEADYAWATRQLMDIADTYAAGRVVSVLEGGYDLRALSRSVEQHVRELLGVNPAGVY